MNIDKLVLTDEEISKVACPDPLQEIDVVDVSFIDDKARFRIRFKAYEHAISLATVKKVWRILNEPCEHATDEVLPRIECGECLREIKLALEEG